jgi:hypothetical protein
MLTAERLARLGAQETAPTDIRKQFQQAGFTISAAAQSPERLEVKKRNCLCYLERRRDGTWVPVGPPYFVVRGLSCELEDRGYQKFWYHEGRRFPTRRNELETLHRFDEEVRYILGLKNLYNESLGSTCARTVYDRLIGRPDR